MAKEFTLTCVQFSTLNYILGHLQGIAMDLDGKYYIDIDKLKTALERLVNEKLEPIVMGLRDQIKEKGEIYEDPEEKTYDLIEAIGLLKDGEKIKRIKWVDSFCLKPNDSIRKLLNLSNEDYEASDWVIVDE